MESNGDVHSITQGNLKFVTDPSGLVKLFKNEDYFGSFGFTLKGTVNSQTRFLNSWSTEWTWEVLSNTDSNITVLASTNWQGLEWKQRWFFSDTEQKFSNHLTNNTGFDVTDTRFYYVVRLDPANVSCLQYIDNQGRENEYCFEQDITITENLEQYLKRISFEETVFNFQDLMSSGFEFKYLFAGQLNNVHPSLAGQGFIIGVTKNEGLFPDGASIELDPSVIDSSDISLKNYGNVQVRNRAGDIWLVYEQFVTSSNTDIFVARSTDNGDTFTVFNLTNTSDKNELLPHIDINSTDGLIIAYDVVYAGITTTDVFVTTCSGDCNASAQFFDDINVSACGALTRCGNSNIVVDVNDFSHLTYAKTASTLEYRRNTGFVGSGWEAEETTLDAGGNAILARDGTGVVVAKNGSNRKLAYTNANQTQANIAFFDGSDWIVDPDTGAGPGGLQIPGSDVQEPLTAFAGYDENFYVAYSQSAAGDSGGKSIHFRQIDQDLNVADTSLWSADLNITQRGLDRALVSMFQASDLNIHIVASPLVGATDVNIFHFVRLPNNVWTTSTIGDGNVLVSDGNRTFNPLLRNRDYEGSFADRTSFNPGPLTFDYSFLTSDSSDGSPSTLVFDTNALGDLNGVISEFTVTPASPFVLDPEGGVTNVNVDFNSIGEEFGIIDINYTWFVNDVNSSSDQNFNRDFNGADADFNIALLVQAHDGTDSFTSQSDQNVLLRTAAQNVDINFVFSAEGTGLFADVNYGVTIAGSTDTINYVVWGFPTDNNLLGLQVVQQYREGAVRDVCAIVNITGDINKLQCETFFNTHIIAKVPLDITDLNPLTPFDVSINIVPTQSFSQVSVDQNFWFVYQNLDSNTFNMLTDANVDFQVSNNLIGLNAVDLNQTIQPYMSPVAAGGISVIFTSKDSTTADIVPDVVINFSRTVTGVGNDLVQSGITDSFGRIALSFIPNIDHNFTVEFPFGTIIKTGTYNPQPIDATNGITLLVPSGEIITDENAVGGVDINFLQVNAQVKSDGIVDLNQIVTSERDISSVTITVDHNSVNLFTDVNSTGVLTGGVFSQSIDVNGLSRLIPLVVTVSLLFTDGNTFVRSRGVSFFDTPGLVEDLVAAREELGDTPGTMILLAFVTATLLGFYHFAYPSPTGDTSSSFILVAVIFSLATVVGWVDGVSWVFATLAGGSVYFLTKVNR